MSKSIDWPGPAFIPGSAVFEFETGRSGVLEERGYIRFEDERVTPSKAARLWRSCKIGVTPLRGPLAQAYKARVRAAEKADRARIAAISPSQPASGAYAAWKQAEMRGLAAANNNLVALTGSQVGDASPEHHSGCQTAWGSTRAPGPADLLRCHGCWAEHMWWSTRLAALTEVCLAFESYLRDSVNELLACRDASWGPFPLRVVARTSQGGDRDWQTLVDLHGLLGARPGADAVAARRLAAERGRFRELEPASSEYEVFSLRLRETCLTPGGLEGLVAGMARAVERARSRLQRLGEPDARVQRGRLIAAAAERGLLELRGRGA